MAVGFRVQGLGFRVSFSGVLGSGFRVSSFFLFRALGGQRVFFFFFGGGVYQNSKLLPLTAGLSRVCRVLGPTSLPSVLIHYFSFLFVLL